MNMFNIIETNLNKFDWEIYVSELTFWKKLNELETCLASKQGNSRGHFTYTELQNLAATIEIYKLIHCVVAVSVILAATYTAGILTVFGSVYLASQVPGTSLYSKKMEICETSVIPPVNDLESDEIETDPDFKYTLPRNSNITNVLRTSLLLASIQTNITDESATMNNNAQYVSWDYWNIPVMDWLAKSSEFVTAYTDEIPSHFPYYLETSVSNLRCIELEDQIHKATKTRIQDQMESSWHMEWIDTLRYRLFLYKLFPYIHDIKA